MAIRLGLALLLLALASSALLAESALSSAVTESGFRISEGANKCNGLIGDCIGEDEEMMMDSEASRRQLAGQSRISRDAMKRNTTPCGKSNRGGRYYGCQPAKANPYKRGCSKITKCQRYTR